MVRIQSNLFMCYSVYALNYQIDKTQFLCTSICVLECVLLVCTDTHVSV